MAWQELGLYHVEVDQIWRERNQVTNAVQKVFRKKATFYWKHIVNVSQCACDDHNWDELNGKPKTTIEVKRIGTLTILADYNKFRDKWVEFADNYVCYPFDKNN